MGWVTGILMFLVLWWTLLFTVLPFGHQRDIDGSPREAFMKKKFIWTTIVTFIVWLCIFALIEADVISFRDMAKTMIEEDYK